jgi:hypothetical protein
MKTIVIASALLLLASATPANGTHGSSRSYGSYRYGRCYNGVSEYVDFDQAVALGKQALAEKNVSLGDVARELREKRAQNRSAAAESLNSTSPQPTAEPTGAQP